MRWVEREAGPGLAPPLAEANRIGRRSAEELLGIAAPRRLLAAIAGWGEPIDPLGDCQLQSSSDSLTISVPGTLHSLAPANKNFDAPRVLQDVQGDFTVEVKVTCPIQPQATLTDRTTDY